MTGEFTRRDALGMGISAGAFAFTAASAQTPRLPHLPSRADNKRAEDPRNLNTDWYFASLVETAEAIRRRKVSPVELAQAMLARIAKLEPSLHSYATVTAGLALSQASRAEAEIAAGIYRGP